MAIRAPFTIRMYNGKLETERYFKNPQTIASGSTFTVESYVWPYPGHKDLYLDFDNLEELLDWLQSMPHTDDATKRVIEKWL